MPITFRCSDCTQKLRIEDAFAGKRVACVRCGSKQRVPLVSSPEFAPPAAGLSELQAPPEAEFREQDSARPVARRREYSKPEDPRHESVGIESAQPAAFPLPPIEPELTQREPIQPVPAVEEGRIDAPVVSQPAASEPTVFEQPNIEEPGQVQTLAEHEGPDDIRPRRRPRVPRSRRVAAASRESSLVPPYKKLDVEEMIDMTAMVDIVFFLLIFFLVTSMHALDSTIPMPAPDPQKGAAREPKSVAAIDADDSYVVVRIDRNDKISIEGSDVRTDRDLLFKLRDLRLSSAHPEKLLVVGHGDATHGTVVMVLDAGRELGMDQVKLTVQNEEE